MLEIIKLIYLYFNYMVLLEYINKINFHVLIKVL